MLQGAIEDNTLTALVHSATLAPQIALKIKATDFSTDVYRRIAGAALDFLERRREPAGVHIGDLLEDEIKKGANGRFIQEVIGEMERLAPLLNEAEVLGNLDDFLPIQTMTGLVNQASDRLIEGNIEAARTCAWGMINSRPATTILPDPWGEPVPPPFDADILPKVLRDFVKERSRTMGVDPAGLLWSALSCCSAALDGSIRLQMKEYDIGFTVPPAIWVLLFGDVSTAKSPILRATWAPLERLQSEAERRHGEAMARWYAEAKEERGPEPVTVRYIAKDATIEKLQEILIRQDRGIAVLRGEWAGLIGQFDKYGSSGGALVDRAFYLQDYDGDSYYVDRIAKGRGGYIADLLLVSCGGIQPDRLRKLGDLISDGMLQRSITPILRRQTTGADEPGGHEFVAAYDALVERLVYVPGGRIITLADAALRVRQRVEERAAALAANEALGPSFRTFAGKLHGMWGRLTLVLGHIVQHEPQQIEGEAAELAEQLLFDQVVRHGATFYEWLGGAGNMTTTQAICEWLISTEPRARVVAYELTNNVRALRGMPSKQMAETVSPLVTMGWLEPEGLGYIPNKWKVHQGIYPQFAERGARLKRQHIEARDLIPGVGAAAPSTTTPAAPASPITRAAPAKPPLATPSNDASHNHGGNPGYWQRREAEREEWLRELAAERAAAGGNS